MIAVPPAGALLATGDPWEPWRLVDPGGEIVQPVAEYLKDLQAAGRAAATQRSYGMDLLRWFRFLWAIDVAWDQVTWAEARDFARRLQLADKPARGRRQAKPVSRTRTAGAPNPVTGKPSPGPGYVAGDGCALRNCAAALLRLHVDAGTGPIINPFPLDRGRRGRGANARNPMEPHRMQRSGQFRPRLQHRIPRSIPDEKFNELFAQLPSLRDRALVAFWVSTGARASELLGARQADADPGQQLITVIRKGNRAVQQLPGIPRRVVGCGFTRRKPTPWSRRDAMSHCGGRSAARSGP